MKKYSAKKKKNSFHFSQKSLIWRGGRYFSGGVKAFFLFSPRGLLSPPKRVFFRLIPVLHHLQFLSKGKIVERRWKFGSGCLKK